MQVGFIVYEGMTALDFIGVYDPLVRLATTGLMFTAAQIRPPLRGYGMIVIPGGCSATRLKEDNDFIDWLKSAEPYPLKVSVCTGSLLLGSAGFLKDRTAITHRSAFTELRKYRSQVIDRRIVDEGDVITARGVTSSVDLGLYLCRKLAGPEAEEKIRQQMDYPYRTYT